MGWHLWWGMSELRQILFHISQTSDERREGSGQLEVFTLSHENLKHTGRPTPPLSLPAPYGSVLLVATGLDTVATGPVAPSSSISAAVAAPDLAAATADDFATAL